MNMTEVNENCHGWRFDCRVNLSVLIQVIFLAALIVSGWVNLQRQLDLLQHDVNILVQTQKQFCVKLEEISAKNITYEYRLQAIERCIPRADITAPSFK